MNFVSWVQKNYLDKKEADKEIPQLKALQPKVTLETIIKGVCAATGSSPEQDPGKGWKKQPGPRNGHLPGP